MCTSEGTGRRSRGARGGMGTRIDGTRSRAWCFPHLPWLNTARRCHLARTRFIYTHNYRFIYIYISHIYIDIYVYFKHIYVHIGILVYMYLYMDTYERTRVVSWSFCTNITYTHTGTRIPSTYTYPYGDDPEVSASPDSHDCATIDQSLCTVIIVQA